MPYLSEVVGVPGAFETLQLLAQSSETAFERETLSETMRTSGVEDADGAIADFVSSGILQGDGDQLRLTTLGIRSALLLEALNGGDLWELYRRLRTIDSGLRAYELVREGMTGAFLRNLNDRPGFGRLYFCSPWINLGHAEQSYLTHAVHMASRRQEPEIVVMTRPEDGAGTPPASLAPFRALGASVFLHPRLHTKLYIREPDASGGYIMAIVGSQNLTRSRYLELGIRINNDSEIIQQLVRYFWELTSWCVEA